MLAVVIAVAVPAPCHFELGNSVVAYMDPSTMPVGYLGERVAGVTVHARGGTGPYQITGTNLLGWPSSLDYKVDPVAGTAEWHGTVTRTGEFPVPMTVVDSAGARSELMLTFVFKSAHNSLRMIESSLACREVRLRAPRTAFVRG